MWFYHMSPVSPKMETNTFLEESGSPDVLPKDQNFDSTFRLHCPHGRQLFPSLICFIDMSYDCCYFSFAYIAIHVTGF